MKKIYFSIVIILFVLSHSTYAQLNYFFSATSKPYAPVKGGIVPHLKTDYTGWTPEDEGFARVPIGFTFKYDGLNYKYANIDVNGFITLKDSLDISYNYPYFRNGIASAPPYYKRPVIAAFWDDLLLPDTSSIVYKTTGYAPFRIFTVEWKRAHWSYDAPDPVLSIELRLFETTNIIEFHYKDEGGLPYAQYAFASIGITSDGTNRDFISLQSTLTHPDISFLKAADSLNVKPANNQVYKFIPSPVPISKTLRSSLHYTNNKAYVKLNSEGFDSYEYAVTHSPIPPESGTRVFSSNITVSSLLPATTYYIYARSNWFGWLPSQWACDSFTTAVKPVKPPYHITGDPAKGEPVPSAGSIIPFDMRRQNFTDTNYNFSTGYNGWTVVTDFPHLGDTSLWGLNFDAYDANEWIFTPGIKLTAGKTYELKFGYLSYYLYNPGDSANMEIKYGTATGAAGMNLGTLFKKTNIKTYEPYDDYGGLPYTDTTIKIKPLYTGEYYFGFHNLTPLTGGIPMIGNLSISEKMKHTTIPVALNGESKGTANVLNWVSNNKEYRSAFEIQKSLDGINFTRIGARNAGKPGNTYAHDYLRIKQSSRETTYWKNFDGKQKAEYEQAVIQKSIDAMSLQKRAGNRKTKISENNLAFTDYNTKGINYYRLKYVDKSGNISYSNIVKLEPTEPAIYPNPVVSNATLQITGNVKNISVSITDMSGKTLWQVNNINAMLIKLPTEKYTSGTYLITVTNGKESKTIKLVKQ